MSASAARVFDCIGIGIGPSNLSLACLLSPFEDFKLRVLDQRSSFVWHEGLLLPEAKIQVPFVKDLVSLVDPTNRYSFLAFLTDQKRIYQFFNSRFDAVRRTEFNQYLQWVSRNLKTLEFSRKVVNVYHDRQFIVETNEDSYRANDLVVGVGRVASIPSCARGKLCGTLVHSSDYLFAPASVNGKRVVVIGGGQSGAEVFLDLISRPPATSPAHCSWISRRSNFFPIDESPFTNEFFSPGYAEHFYRLSSAVRRQHANEQKLASDGISTDTITRIYQAIYERRHLQRSRITLTVSPSSQLIEIHKQRSQWQVAIMRMSTGQHEVIEADVVILATGYRFELPGWLDPIVADLEMEGQEIALNDDFSAKWNRPVPNRIYMQNAGRMQWGVADPNLSLISWRSGKIINSLLGYSAYDLEDRLPAIDWTSRSDPLQGQASA